MADLVLGPDTGDTLSLGRIGKAISNIVSEGAFSALGTAGEIINGGRVVFLAADGLIYMADNTVLAEAEAAVGVSMNAAALGAPVEIATTGSIVDSLSSLTPGQRVYFDNLGMLVQPAPAVGNHRSVGVAKTTTSILVNLGEVIAR